MSLFLKGDFTFLVVHLPTHARMGWPAIRLDMAIARRGFVLW